MTGTAQEFWFLIPRRAIGITRPMGLGGNGAVSALIATVVKVIFVAVRIKLSLHSECPSTCSFPFFLFIFWPCAIEDCTH